MIFPDDNDFDGPINHDNYIFDSEDDSGDGDEYRRITKGAPMRDNDGRYTTAAKESKVLGPPTPILAQPSDPLKVMEAVRSITGYHIGNPPSLDLEKQVHYCLAGQGAVEIRRNRIGLGIRKVEKVAGLAEVPCGFVMQIPKVPWGMFAQTVTFFREVIRTKGHGNPLESIVQIFFNPAAADGEDPYSLYIPPQRVSAASVHHDGGNDPDGHLIHVADIHSHGSMSAFFSGTDDGDECRAERLYGVVGNVMDSLPTMRFRARVGAGFVDIPISSMIDIPDETIRVPVSLSRIINSPHSGGGQRGVEIDPFDGYPIDVAWLEQVTAGGSTSLIHRGGNQSDRFVERGDSFRPCWDPQPGGASRRDSAGGAPLVPYSHATHTTIDAPILVAAPSGQRYMDTVGGIVPIDIRES